MPLLSTNMNVFDINLLSPCSLSYEEKEQRECKTISHQRQPAPGKFFSAAPVNQISVIVQLSISQCWKMYSKLYSGSI